MDPSFETVLRTWPSTNFTGGKTTRQQAKMPAAALEAILAPATWSG
jgi:hypothetical protein